MSSGLYGWRAVNSGSVDSVDSTTLRTPEGVVYQLAVAGVGSRFSAAVIDSILQFVVVIVLMVASGSPLSGEGGIGSAFAVVASFIVMFGYQFLCEAFFNGRTIGKRLNRLRVVNLHGGPISIRESAVRNAIRIVDFLPAFYFLGMLTMVTTPTSQRVGDFAAGTFVVREPWEPRKRRRFRRRDLTEHVRDLELSQSTIDEMATWDLMNLTRTDVGIVRQFLARREGLDAETRTRIANEFAGRLRPQVHGVDPNLPSERFLELLVEAKQIRR